MWYFLQHIQIFFSCEIFSSHRITFWRGVQSDDESGRRLIGANIFSGECPPRRNRTPSRVKTGAMTRHFILSGTDKLWKCKSVPLSRDKIMRVISNWMRWWRVKLWRVLYNNRLLITGSPRPLSTAAHTLSLDNEIMIIIPTTFSEWSRRRRSPASRSPRGD